MEEKEITLTINNKEYKVIKLDGEGQCSCYGCEQKSGWNTTWTSFCYRYNGHIYCYYCLKELLEKES